MSTLSTHILNTTTGTPAPDIPVRLTRLLPPSADSSAVGSTVTREFEVLAGARTDEDGRVGGFGELVPGVYQLWFEVARDGQESFYPEVTVTFTITDERHYHVPLLLSPFAFSTYRGS
jgi:5-hydroxyisourate hydrolase